MTAPNIFPALRYRDAAAAMDWLERVFGFTRTFATPGENGGIGHAELRLDAGTIMLGSGAPSLADEPARDFGEQRMSLYVAVADVEAHYARAVEQGAEITYPLRTMDYGSTEYGARDLEGIQWSFGTYLPTPGDE